MVEAGLEDAMRRLGRRNNHVDGYAPHRDAYAPTSERNYLPLPNVAEENDVRAGAGRGGVVAHSAAPRAKAGGGREMPRSAMAPRTGAIVMASWRVALHAAVRVQRVWRGHMGRATARKALERSAGGWLHDEGDSAVARHRTVGVERQSMDSPQSGFDFDGHENGTPQRDEGKEGRGGEIMTRNSKAVDTLVSAMALLQGGVQFAGADDEAQNIAATMAVLQGEFRRVSGALGGAGASEGEARQG
jgi:hypothetical protein